MRVVAISGAKAVNHTHRAPDPAIKARGLSVSTIKHAPPRHRLDRPVKTATDTVALGRRVIIASDTGWARIAAATKPASRKRSRRGFGPWTWCSLKDSNSSKA
jgi:molybdopterin-guanine dinucleotide biosynthesis protein